MDNLGVNNYFPTRVRAGDPGANPTRLAGCEGVEAVAPQGALTDMGWEVRKLDTEALHVLRKDLKKLRYAADTFAPIYPDAKVATYVKELKSLQDSFGHLNDAAMAAEALTGPEAPGRDDGDVQRGVGWVLGTLTVRAGQQRPDLFARWDRLRAARPFWS